MIGKRVCVAEACKHPLVPRPAMASCCLASPLKPLQSSSRKVARNCECPEEAGSGSEVQYQALLRVATDACQRAHRRKLASLGLPVPAALEAASPWGLLGMTSHMRTRASPTATSARLLGTHASNVLPREIRGKLQAKVPVTAAFVPSFWCI